MKKSILFCFLCISHMMLFGQGLNVKWGEEITNGRFDEIIPTQQGSYVATKTDGSFLEEITSNYTTRISLIQDLKVVRTVELPKELNGKKLRYEGTSLINKQLVVFFSIKEKTKCTILRQAFSENLVPSSLVELISYEQAKPFISENDIYIIDSRDRAFGGVFYTMEEYKKKEMSFGFVVLNDSLSVVSKGEQRIPLDANQLSFGTHVLSSSGELYLSFNEKFSASRKKIKNSLLSNLRIGPFSLFPAETLYTLDNIDDLDAIQKIHLYKCATNQISLLTHTLSITTINKYKMLFNSEGAIMLVGSFLRVKQNKIVNRNDLTMNGMFTLLVDTQNWRITQEKYSDLPLNVYTYGLRERKKNKLEVDYSLGKLLPKLYDFTCKNASILPNGDVVGFLEQVVRNVTYTSSNNGYSYGNGVGFGTGMGSYGTGVGGYSSYNSTANVTYYFKDIIAFCMKSDGTIRWMKKIEKVQASSTYDGAYASCMSFLTTNTFSILFSDNPKNYAENGVFLTNKKVHSNPIFAKNNIVSRVAINLQTGDTKREQFLPKTSDEGNYMPRDFSYDATNHTLLLLLNIGTLGNKIRCGSIEIKHID